jgi:flagellar motor component MotA
MGAKVAGAFTAVLFGVVLADILIHPVGTTAAGNAAASILTPTYNALLGGGR